MTTDISRETVAAAIGGTLPTATLPTSDGAPSILTRWLKGRFTGIFLRSAEENGGAINFEQVQAILVETELPKAAAYITGPAYGLDSDQARSMILAFLGEACIRAKGCLENPSLATNIAFRKEALRYSNSAMEQTDLIGR